VTTRFAPFDFARRCLLRFMEFLLADASPCRTITFSCTNSAINRPETAQRDYGYLRPLVSNYDRFETGKVRVRKELRQKLVEKFWDVIERLAAHMLPGNPKEKEVWSRMIRNGPAKNVIPAFVARLKHEPDDKVAALLAELDSMQPDELMRTVFKVGLAHLPKKHGGRPGTFSLDVRRRAVDDVGHEYSRCDSFSEAIDVVAARYGMESKYLRRVWKNRKRLRQRED